MSEELRVPKRRVTVELVLAGGERRAGDVFLSGFAAGHEGPQRLSDLLNGEEEFVPVVEAGRTTFVRRDGIALARVPVDVEHSGAEDAALPREFPVALELEGGAVLEGTISFVRPDDRSRLQDYLNAPEPFLEFLEKDGVATFVNRRRILRVIERR